MNSLILGNIVGFAASSVMIVAGLLKEKRYILLAMCLQYLLFIGANLLLGAYSGVVVNVINIVLNLTVLKRDLSLPMKLGFIAADAALILTFNDAGLVGLLPLAAASIYILTLDTKNGVFFKLVIITTVLFWAVYDFCFQNYATLIFDLATVFSNLIGILRYRRGERKNSSPEPRE